MTRGCIAVVMVALVGCSERSGPPPPRDAARVTRVFEKPRKGVRAVPPHAIRAEGVGPYLLGTPLKSLLSLTGRGPRVQLMQLEGVVEYSLVRAENETIVMGVGRRDELLFITVVDGEIARTEKGAGVGVGADALREALGAPRYRADVQRDPRVRIYEALPNVRFVIERDVVVAVTVGHEDRVPPAEPAAPSPDAPIVPVPPPRALCGADKLRDKGDDIVRAARAQPSAHLSFGCLSDDQPLVVVTDGGRVTGVTGTADKLRRIRVATLTGLIYAAPLDIGGDGSDEIIAITSGGTPTETTWRIEVYRADGARFTRVLGREIYQVSSVNVPWIGSELDDIELLVEVAGSDDTVRVGGLLLQRKRGRVINAAPLLGRKFVVRGRTAAASKAADVDGGPPPPAPVDAGATGGDP